MPYIKDTKRYPLDSVIDNLHQTLVELGMDDEENNMEGNLNYVITRLLMMIYGDAHSTNYSQINDAIGVIECVKQEYYRKVAGPYEDIKELENGKIKRFSSEPEIVGEITIDETEAALDEMVKINQENGLYD
jgi:hypothetical protein